MKNDIKKQIQQQLNHFVETVIFPEFKKIAEKSIDKNYYDIYSPKYYKRKYRFKNKWELEYKNGRYRFYINEKVGFRNKGKWYYLPEIATEGKIRRIKGRIKGQKGDEIVYLPIPFISTLRNELKANKIFIELLKRYGLEIE